MLVFLTLAAVGLLLLLVSAFGGHDTEFHADIDHAGQGLPTAAPNLYQLV